MLLAVDRLLGETMMQLVPSSAAPPTSCLTTPSLAEFDLGLLPSDDFELPLLDAACAASVSGSDFHVPSPTHVLDVANVLSPTMFSPAPPADSLKSPLGHAHCASPPPTFSIRTQRYEPYPRVNRTTSRMSSTETYSSVSSPGSLADELEALSRSASRAEAAQASSLLLPPPPPYATTVKTEPTESAAASGSTSELRKALENDSFVTRYGLKPFDFVLTTGFASSNLVDSFKVEDLIKTEPLDELPPPPAYRPRQDPVMASTSASVTASATASTSTSVQTVEDEDMEPVISMVFEHFKKDIEAACVELRIASDPSLWSEAEVYRWLSWTLRRYDEDSAASASAAHLWAGVNGRRLVAMTMNDFCSRTNESAAHTLYDHLDIWKSTSALSSSSAPSATLAAVQEEETYDIPSALRLIEGEASEEPANNVGMFHLPSPLRSEVTSMGVTLSIVAGPAPSLTVTKTNANMGNAPVAAVLGLPSATSPASSDGEEADDDEDFPAASASAAASTIPRSSSSSSIHLWQFVKELLNNPAEHSGCIHWLDRSAGIFKIVDSTRVATLWGQRKNRPAMNYDKLSRSLRQYYKKGIMKKTERTQRLIYQFCNPYHL